MSTKAKIPQALESNCVLRYSQSLSWIESSLTPTAQLINWEGTKEGREREQNRA